MLSTWWGILLLLAGADHWAFQPLRRPPVPGGEGNPIDAFVRARLGKEGLAPAPEAGRETLIRRAYLDLIGLPPPPDESGAYEEVVERLLASPHYGEKWARHWLDQARYADSDGYEKDWVRPHAWRYRQWVIESLNRDMPFDQFTVEQIAGDLLPGATVEQRVATGFHRNTLFNREGGVDSEQFRVENVMDRAATTGQVWLGLTFGCAQCHDHKYDPIKQRDYYQLFAFFDNVEDTDIDAPLAGEMGPWLKTRAEYRKKRDELLEAYKVPALQAAWEIEMLTAAANPGQRTDWDLAWDCLLKLTEGGDGEKILRTPARDRTERERDVLATHFVRNYHFAVGTKHYKELKLDELDRKLRELEAAYPQLSQACTISEGKERRKTHLRVRGDYKSLGIEVQPGTPGFLPPLGVDGAATRLDLARWLVREDNPLVARVAVNRIWQEYFGQGLVRTSEDFGTQGEKPTHPELLDWLASEFVESGWSRKHIHRLIVLSATYRQSSRTRPELQAKDPNNTLLARQSRLRLPAELIRDCALGVSGLLSDEVGGKSVRPPQPKGVTELSYDPKLAWEESSGADRYRRGIYVQFQRTTPYPLLMNFDAPRTMVAQCRRLRSNTPLQALNLLNDPVFLEAARALAARVLAESGGGTAGRIERAWRLALARPPQPAEASRLTAFLEKQESLFASEPGAAEKLQPAAAWVSLASVLLNLDEFITRE